MKTVNAAAAAASFLAIVFAAGNVSAEDPPKPGGKTEAKSTAEAGFEAIRKAAADHDEATLTLCLPSKLVAKWPDDAAGDGKAWRAALAERIAAGTVVKVSEKGDDAIARWKSEGPDSVWEMRLRRDGSRWVAASPWAYLVGGAELAKVNGKSGGHVKLKARRTDPYGPSAFSFTHVTQNPKQCLNRMDVWFCQAGELHMSNSMITALGMQDLAKVEGLQPGDDWMDEITPRVDNVYVIDVKSESDGRRDFQVALKETAKSDDAIEFDWRLVAGGKNAPSSVKTPQPLVSNDGTDGEAAQCGKRRK